MTNLADLLPAGGGQNNTDFVADGTISSGAPVILTAAGKAAAVAESSVTEAVGTPVAFGGGPINPAVACCYDTTNSKVVIVYGDNNDSGYGKAIVGTVSGSTISFGTQVTFAGSGTVGDLSIVFDPDSGKVVIAFRDNSNSGYGTAIVGTVSGTSISFGSAAVFSSSSNNYNSAVYDTSNDKVFISFTNPGSSNVGQGVVGTVSGTSISFGSATTFSSASPTYPTSSAFDSSENKVVTAYMDGTNGNSQAIVGTISGTSVSFGSATTFTTAYSADFSTAYDANANKILISFEDVANSSYGTAIVGTVSGTSISFGSKAVYEAANGSFISSVYDSNAKRVVIVYGEGFIAGYSSAVNATISGTSVSFTSPFQLVATYNNPMMITFDSDNKKVVEAYNSSGSKALVYTPPSTETNLTSTNLLGIASGAISDTATGTINTWGSRNEVQTGLTIGSDYYVQNDGRIEAGVTNIAFDISSATYTQNFDISSQATIPQAIAFNPTGTKMFIVDIAGQDVNEYALSTGFDVSSASYTQNFSVASQDTAPTGISFNAAGTKMFVCGYTNDNVYEYTLSSGFNLSTASYAQALDVSGQDTLPKDVVFNTDGTKMFVLGGTGEDVNEYTLSAYDISTASFVDSFSVASQESAPDGIAFNTDGTKMFIVGNGDTVFQYNLSSGFDVSTASYASISFSVTSQETGPTGIAFSADGTKMFIVGTQGDDVNQYATTANSFSTDHLIGQAITATQINIKDYTG
jgi:sugar lactone lactonase YvrE